MLAGGAESCIHPLAFVGFERSKSLSTAYNEWPERASRPFDKDRDGFVIGEGSAVLVLEELQHALGRGAHIYAEVKGYGTSSDAHHLTTPPFDGDGARRAMHRALRTAQISPSQLDYINAHATSTRLGDLAELRAIASLILDSGRSETVSRIDVSSTKGAVGHLLGAAGAAESLFSILAIQHDVLPPTLNLDNLDSQASSECNIIRQQSISKNVTACLTNSFGFGGTNASLCFTKYKD